MIVRPVEVGAQVGMRLTEPAGLLASSITAAYLATHSAVVAATVAIAVSFSMITGDHHQSLHSGHCACALGREE
jgi:hypothetical protein